MEMQTCFLYYIALGKIWQHGKYSSGVWQWFAYIYIYIILRNFKNDPRSRSMNILSCGWIWSQTVEQLFFISQSAAQSIHTPHSWWWWARLGRLGCRHWGALGSLPELRSLLKKTSGHWPDPPTCTWKMWLAFLGLLPQAPQCLRIAMVTPVSEGPQADVFVYKAFTMFHNDWNKNTCPKGRHTQKQTKLFSRLSDKNLNC